MLPHDALAWLQFYIRSLIGLVLLAAALGKVLQFRVFADTVHGFRLLPRAFVPWVAGAILPAEGLVAMLLITGAASAFAAAAAVLLLVVFSGAIALNLLRGRADIACGCFGDTTGRLRWFHVGSNLAMAIAVVLTLPITPALPDPVRLPTTPALSALAAAAITFACWLLGRLALQLFRGVPVVDRARTVVSAFATEEAP